MKRFILTVVIGLGAGSFAFVCMLYIASSCTGGAEQYFSSVSGSHILKSAFACIVVSLGFSVSSLIYYSEKIALGNVIGSNIFNVLMVLGTVVFLLTGSFAGWISGSFFFFFLYITFATLSALIIGLIIMAKLKHEAKWVNEKLYELNREDKK